MKSEQFVYVTYIRTTPEKLWKVLLESEMTRQYWQHDNISDWKVGSKWEHRGADESRVLKLVGKVVESAPPRRLVITWARPADAENAGKHSRVSFDIEPTPDGTVRLTVTHSDLEPGSEMLGGISRGWPIVLSSLKTLLETGQALPKLW